MSLNDNLLKIINVMVNIGSPTTATEVHEKGISLPFTISEVQRLMDVLVKHDAATVNKRNRKYRLDTRFYKAAKEAGL